MAEVITNMFDEMRPSPLLGAFVFRQLSLGTINCFVDLPLLPDSPAPGQLLTSSASSPVRPVAISARCQHS